MKKLSQVNFSNGAKYKIYLMHKPPIVAKEANDYLKLVIQPEKGRGDVESYYMNIYDCNNFIWLLSNAILHAHELGIDVMPKS